MAKLLLFSIILAMIGFPIIAAREPNLKRGLKKVVLLMILFNLFYLIAVRYIYPRL